MKNPSIEINVVLVRSLYSRNVGSVSRAMANMGAQRLILIEPACEIDLEARQGAAGAQTHLVEHTRYASWDEFYQKEPEGVRIAFCAKEKKETDLPGYRERIKNLVGEDYLPRLPLYLIFGPEDHGLSNDDVKLANFICQLPIYGPFTSMNLSHAVLTALFITRDFEAQAPVASTSSSSGAASTENGSAPPTREPGEAQYVFPEEAIETWLHTLGFEFGERRTDVYKVIKRILLRNLSSAKELRMLEAVVNQTIRKLPKREVEE